MVYTQQRDRQLDGQRLEYGLCGSGGCAIFKLSEQRLHRASDHSCKPRKALSLCRSTRGLPCVCADTNAEPLRHKLVPRIRRGLLASDRWLFYCAANHCTGGYQQGFGVWEKSDSYARNLSILRRYRNHPPEYSRAWHGLCNACSTSWYSCGCNRGRGGSPDLGIVDRRRLDKFSCLVSNWQSGQTAGFARLEPDLAKG